MKRRTLLGQLGAGLIAWPVCDCLSIATARADDHAAPHWGYTGEGGPDHWGALESDFKSCSLGTQQSPIDIVDAVPAKIGELKIAYRATPLRILNNGHTVQINYDPGSSLSIRGRSYQIVQFHFHTPSEHTIDGKHYDMELHIVHQNAAKELAVLGVFLKSGTANEALAPVWSALPAVETPERAVPGVSVNAADLLPASHAYYQYQGSLTTPPCSEGVLWLVLAQPVDVSAEQVAKFKRAFPVNARPVQPLDQRFVFEQT